MILVQLNAHPFPHLGVKTPQGILDVTAALQDTPQDGVPATLAAVIQGAAAARVALDGFVQRSLAADTAPRFLHGEASVTFAPCVAAPSKIICVGLNYRRHAAETGMAVPTSPVLFSKYPNAVAAAGEAISLPGNATEYDYEAELGVVMGQRAKNVRPDEALDYVLGYCNINDLSARDLQRRTSQWLLGKTLDGFLPTGPYLVTADEVRDPQNLDIRLWLNGELRQNSNTVDMIFGVATVVSYLSRYMTLEPGDVICTGTPEGVILGMPEKAWLKPGDEVTVEISGLGRLTNPLVGGDQVQPPLATASTAAL